MKSINLYITEKLKISKNNIGYKYFPKSKDELKEIVDKLVDEQSMEDVINLNDIDTSGINNMIGVFGDFEGIIKIDVSKWDVSNVINMTYMFNNCINLEEIIGIENWDISECNVMVGMFKKCESFNMDLSKWKLRNKCHTNNMFKDCPLENQPEKCPQNYKK